MKPHDIHLPITHRSGTPAIIKAKYVPGEDEVAPAWILPGGVQVNRKREAVKRGTSIFKSAGWN